MLPDSFGPFSGTAKIRSPQDRETARARLDTRVRAALWQSVWEATQTMSYAEIRETVERTLQEVTNDEP